MIHIENEVLADTHGRLSGKKEFSRKEEKMKKRLTVALVLAVVISMVFSGAVLAWDEEDPCVANNADFWNVNGEDDGIKQLGPVWPDGYVPTGQTGEQHPTPYIDKDGNEVFAHPTGYNLYRDDVTNTGNLDWVRIRTDTPGNIHLNEAYLTESKYEHWKNCPLGKKPVKDNPACIWCWKVTYENPDTWYWATEPRGINYPEPEPRERDPNRFTVTLKWGWQSTTRFVSEKDNTIRGGIEAVGKYDETQYMLSIPAGTVIERPSGDRPHQLNLRDIDGDKLTFGQIDVEFSKPCVLYVEEGEDEWVEVGSFTSIVDRTAQLE